MGKQHFWNNRLRIPIVEPLLDTCRFLPEIVQTSIMLSLYILFGSFFLWIHVFTTYGETILVPFILFIQIFLFFILAHRNYVYRRISKIDKAIEIGILWVVTKKDERRMMRHIIIGLIMFVLTLSYQYCYGFETWSKAMIIYMISIFYLFKGLFYVPALYIKYERITSLLILSDDSGKDHYKMNSNQLKKIEIGKDWISFIPENKEQKLTTVINFTEKIKNIDDFSGKERRRFYQFVTGVFPEKEILLIH